MADDNPIKHIREGHAATTRPSDANHDKILRIAADYRWTYEEAHDYVITLGIAFLAACNTEDDDPGFPLGDLHIVERRNPE